MNHLLTRLTTTLHFPRDATLLTFPPRVTETTTDTIHEPHEGIYHTCFLASTSRFTGYEPNTLSHTTVFTLTPPSELSTPLPGTSTMPEGPANGHHSDSEDTPVVQLSSGEPKRRVRTVFGEALQIKEEGKTSESEKKSIFATYRNCT